MGSGISLPDEVTKDQAKEFAGERWNEQMAIKFDTIAGKQGTVSRSVIEEHRHGKELSIKNWGLICARASRLADQVTADAPTPLENVDIEIDNKQAVIKMQGLARARQGKLETRRKLANQINSSLEYAQERKDNKLDLFMANLTEKLPELESKQTTHDALLDTIDKMRQKGWPGNIEIEGKYAGIHLPNPLTKDAIIDVMDKLNDQARKEAKKRKQCAGIKGILHAKYALQIALNYMDVVRKLPSVVHVSTALSGKLTVIGDIHGQLRDLIQIFRHNGLPSFDNPYLFNGDLVDRGDYSAEVLLLLMGFAICDPGSIYINRGNHEDMTVCTGYGFVDELVTKFSQNTNGRHLLAVIDTIFSLLPLAHVIDENVLVIHGGISDKFDLDKLMHVNRRLYRTLTGLPNTITQTPGGRDKEGHTHEIWSILMDCLWSDPAKNAEPFPPGTNCKPNDERGGGIMFNANFSQQWLEKHHLGVMVRSHECQEMGFQSTHNDRVLTLFSASNYYGDDEENDGAILVLSPLQETQGTLLTYSTSYHGTGAYQKMNLGQSVTKLESAAMQRVELALLDHRREIISSLKQLDPDNKGIVKSVDWARAMNDTIPIKLPWLHLKAKFVDAVPGDDNSVNYHGLLLKLESAFESENDKHNTPEERQFKENLHRMRDEFTKLFRILDTDGSGLLDRDEFVKGCELINGLKAEQVFDPSDVDKFMKQLDVNGDGKIRYVPSFFLVSSSLSQLRRVLRGPHEHGEKTILNDHLDRRNPQ